jgi:tetratricopeptide (TPR) repeat protein/transcriptional regulator with XRE-family HTH domain
VRVAEIYPGLVRKYRLAAGLTQEELAALAGLDVRTISDIERGRTTRPRRSTLDLLARALDRDDLSYAAVRAGQLVREQAPGYRSGSASSALSPYGRAGPAVVPRQLPPGVRHFTGRAAELAALSGLADQARRDEPGMVVISAIGGTAGVGKTALAVHWAHRAGDQFPDGQLYVNLRGYDPRRPVPAADALAGFLRALGVPGPDIPAGTEERAARYRSLLAGQRMLVLLDNAKSAEQVRPLLPAAAGCMVVVTSRDALAGLVARDGAARLDLDLLPLPEAAELLRRLIGERAQADPAATDALARRCARLPLALRVAAELTAARPADSLAGLVVELADLQRRLDLFEAGGDGRAAVRTVFSWSCRQLGAPASRAFRLAGLHPGPDFDIFAVAALTGLAAGQAGRAVDQLARAHLIQPAGPGRYGMHDLLRAYARELATTDGTDGCQAALTRLLDYYLFTAAAAMDTLFPAERHRRPRIPAQASPVPPVSDPAAASAWLDAHRSSLLAAAVHASGSDQWSSQVTQLAATLFRYLDLGHTPEAITMHTCARRAARRAGDQGAEATALTSLGGTARRQGRTAHAIGYLRKALTLFRNAGDQTGEARALANLGNLYVQQGRYQQAARNLSEALVICRATDEQTGQAQTLCSLGLVDTMLGRYSQAVSQLQLALDICRQVGYRTIEPYILTNLGDVDLRRGRYQQAAVHTRQALDQARQSGDRPAESSIEAILGDIAVRQGRYQEAMGHLRRALALFRETGERTNETYVLAILGDLDLRQGCIAQACRKQRRAAALFALAGDQIGETLALNGLGEALLAHGRPKDAHARHTIALNLARKTGDSYQLARAHAGLGNALLATGDHRQAHRHLQLAVTRYTRLGAPEADQIRASRLVQPRNLVTRSEPHTAREPS